PLETASKHSRGGMRAPGSKNFTSNLPPDMRSMSLVKRTPEGPRCVSALPKALCIFQRILSWALAALAITVNANADAPSTPSLSRLLDMWHSSHFGRQDSDTTA